PFLERFKVDEFLQTLTGANKCFIGERTFTGIGIDECFFAATTNGEINPPEVTGPQVAFAYCNRGDARIFECLNSIQKFFPRFGWAFWIKASFFKETFVVPYSNGTPCPRHAVVFTVASEQLYGSLSRE